MANTIWNASDKTSGITVSSELATANQFNFNGVRSTNGKTIASGGKFYYELTCNGAFSDARSYIGFAGNTAVLGAEPNSAHVASLNKAGTQMVVAGFAPITVAFGAITSKTFGVAVDFTAKKWWMTTDGINWNAGGTADPTTGVGADTWTSQFAADTTFHIATTIIDNTASVTLNAGNSAFAFGAPSGFDPWDAAAPPTTSTIALVLPHLIFAAAGVVANPVSGVAAMTLPSLVLHATVNNAGPVTSDIVMTLPSLIHLVSVSEQFPSSIDFTLPPLIFDAIAEVKNPIHTLVEMTLPPLTQALLGSVRIPIQGGGEPNFFVRAPKRTFHVGNTNRTFTVADVNRHFRIRPR